MSFVHLSIHTEYSLHDSLVRIKPLMAKAASNGMPAVAITDDSNLFCAIKAYKAAMAEGIKPIIGAQVLIKTGRIGCTPLQIICRDNDGYLALTQIISRGYNEAVRDKEGRPIIPLEWFRSKSSGMIALSGGRQGEIGRLLLNKRSDTCLESISEFREIFGKHFYLELQRVGHAADDRYIKEAVSLAIDTGTPVVATNPVRFMEMDEFTSHEIRLAISQGRPVRSLRDDLEQACTPHQYFKSADEMQELFSDIPESLTNTVRIAEQCNVDLTLGTSYLPSFPVPEGMTEADFLEKLAYDGLEKRLKFYFKTDEQMDLHRQEYKDRLAFELNTINEMGFPGYFLIVSDFIQWSKRSDIPVGPGRGSGAGSLVAYALEITDLNPIPYALLFERFLNPERVSMPDFDIDFCMDKRDRVIQYVADTYGHQAVSQIITYGTMAAKMVVKDVARSMSHPYRFGDAISKLIPKRPDITLADAMAESSELKMMYETDGAVREVMDHALKLEGLTRQVGKHAGGVLIAPGALTDYTATYREAPGSSLVSQFDKDDVETAGLVKFDFLGLRNLTIIDHAIKSINARRKKSGQTPIDILDIDLNDRPAFELLQRCETTAVFQLESAGMKNLIKRLQPDCFEDIVALVALFRPGPLQSGMVDDFIDRKHGRAEVTFAHPSLKPVLENTYGVIVYQEQVMQIAQVMAGYTLGGADMLRRAMGKKKPEEMAKQRQIFIKGAINNNIEPDLAASTFDLMEKFAAYGFNKSHSAAYALIAFQTAYLKAHYPADFMAAVLSSDMDDTDKVVRFVHECRSMGLEISPPDANQSDWLFSGEGNTVIYGLGAIKGLGENAARDVLNERSKGGSYQNMTDFIYRNAMNKRVVEACINAGLFDYTNLDRGELLEVYPLAISAGKQLKKSAGQGMLFDMEIPDIPRKSVPALAENLKLKGERKVLGLYLTGHPYEQYRHSLSGAMTASLAEILTNVEDETTENSERFYSVTVAGLITDIDIKSNTKGNYAFFKLDDGTARMDCKIFNRQYHDFQAFVRDDNMVVLEGVVRVDPRGGEASLLINSVQLLESFLDNQSGLVIIDLPSDVNLAEASGYLETISELNDEGSLRVCFEYRDEMTETPLLPISASGMAMERLRELWPDKVRIEYSQGQQNKKSLKKATDIISPEGIENLEAKRSVIRRQLEQYLDLATKAMYNSSEQGPAPDC